MLVVLKEPMGYSTIDGHRIYGKCYAYGSFGPSSISKKTYFKNKDILEEVEITGSWLSKKTGKIFPNVSFLLTKMSELDLEITIEIARLLDIVPVKKPDKAALSRSIVKRIERL